MLRDNRVNHHSFMLLPSLKTALGKWPSSEQSKLTVKLCLILTTTTIGSIALVVWLIHKSTVDELRQLEISALQNESNALRVRMLNAVDELRRDTLVLSNWDSTETLLKNRLDRPASDNSALVAKISVELVEFLRVKPQYLQARIIAAEDGQELVRVERPTPFDAPQITPPENLQSKQHRAYFQEAMKLPPGGYYLSAINLNREHGVIQTPATPVLRLAVPLVYDGNVYGIVVINFAMGSLFDELSALTPHNGTLYLANRAGQFLIHADPSRNFEFEFNSEAGNAFEQFPELDVLLDPQQTELSVAFDKTIHSYLTLALNPEQPEMTYFFILARPFERVLPTSTRIIEQTFGVIALMTLIAIGLGSVIAREVTQPITRLNEQLKRKNKHLEEFIFIASHDLQEPVRTLQTFTGLLAEEASDDLSSDAQEAIGFIDRSAARLSDLLAGLLMKARVGRETDARQTDLNAVLQDVIEDLDTAILESGADIRVSPLPSLMLYKAAVRQLFQNLIGNALKFRRAGVSPVVKVSAERQGNDWRFQVADNGIGIEPEYRNKVFSAFQRLHRQEDYEGNGIGLAICEEVVGLHRGEIWIEDNPGGGTCFCFTLVEA